MMLRSITELDRVIAASIRSFGVATQSSSLLVLVLVVMHLLLLSLLDDDNDDDDMVDNVRMAREMVLFSIMELGREYLLLLLLLLDCCSHAASDDVVVVVVVACHDLFSFVLGT